MPLLGRAGPFAVNRQHRFGAGLQEAVIFDGLRARNYASATQPVFVGDPTGQANDFGGGVRTSSGTNYVTLTPSASLYNVEYTVSLAVQNVTIPADYTAIVELATASGRLLSIFLNTAGDINFVTSETINSGGVSGANLAAGKTTRLTMSRRGNTLYFYSNGAPIGNVGIGGSDVAGAAWYLGNNISTGGAHPNAIYNDLLVWTGRGFTDAEVAAHADDPYAMLRPLPVQRFTRWIAGASSGTTYNDTISDAVTAAESNAVALTARPTISDAGTAAESMAAAATLAPSLSDAVTAAEAQAVAATFNAALSDSAAAADAVTGTVSTVYNEAISDSVTASDVMQGELPATGESHDAFKRRTRRERALDAAARRAEEEWRTERNAVRLALEAAMGMAAEVVEDAPAQAVAAVQEAAQEARTVAPVLRAPAVDAKALASAQAALERLQVAVEEAARLKALAEDDEEVLMLLRAL